MFKRESPLFRISALIFLLIVLAIVIYLLAGSPSITGNVVMNEQEFSIITPFGFNFSMLVIGALSIIFAIFMIMREGMED